MDVEWSPLAKLQLKEIVQYVADNFGERVSQKSLKKIVNKVYGLVLFPESGTYDKKLSTRNFTVRHITLHPNVIYYITIMAIAHEKQSPKTVSEMIFRFLEHHIKE